jgi:hypothetical protein
VSGSFSRSASFARALWSHSSREPLRALPPVRHALALGAIFGGGLVYTLFGVRRSESVGYGDAIVSIGGTGDHIRMLNAFTRMKEVPPVAVYTNDNVRGLDGIFADVAVRDVGGAHGSSFISPSAISRIFRSQPIFNRALIAQPMETQPIAIAFGAAIAREVVVHGAGCIDVDRRVAFDATSWSRSYERFFEICYPDASFGTTPRIHDEYRWIGGRKLIAFHTGGSGHVRGIDEKVFPETAKGLSRLGYSIAVVGSKSESEGLHRLFTGVDCEYWIEMDLASLASRLKQSAALVAIDSSMMNLADAIGLPSVIIYNLTRPETHGPFTTKLVPIVCRDARTLGTAYDVRWDLNRDRRGTGPSPNDLIGAVESLG